MHHLSRKHFPFTAIVGQDQLRTGLLLNAIHPRIGGILVRGAKGTAKSTAARALAEVLPVIEVVEGCPYRCHPRERSMMCDACAARHEAGETLPRTEVPVPFVTLPLSATEDRVAGTIDVGEALSKGTVACKPGLLAEANRGILYVDEVNLLDDHLVNVLLDAAAMGRNIVEREGVSVVHPARFILIGTMNPEEGELRPQLLDRFGITVEVTGIDELDARVEIMERLEAFDRDAEAFGQRFAANQHALSHRIADAMARLAGIQVPRSLRVGAAQRALQAGVDGHRADIAMLRAAVTLAAWEGAAVVSERHLDEVAPLVLAHRLRRRPFERRSPAPASEPSPPAPEASPASAPSSLAPEPSPPAPEASPASAPSSLAPEPSPPAPEASAASAPSSPAPEASAASAPSSPAPHPPPASAGPDVAQASPGSADAEPVDVEAWLPEPKARGKRAGGSAAGNANGRGKVLGVKPRSSDDEPVDVAASLLAAATREGPGRQAPVPSVSNEDLRARRVVARAKRMICFLVDASRSMATRQRLEAVRQACRQLLEQSYQGRHQVTVVTAGGQGPELVVAPTRDVEGVDQLLAEVEAGGRTPLAGALARCDRELRRAVERGLAPTLVVLTDGRANVPLTPGGDAVSDTLAEAGRLAELGPDALVVDTENDFINLGLGRELAEALGADYLQTETPDADGVLRWLGRA
jgi:magnesium chelatase subunit D